MNATPIASITTASGPAELLGRKLDSLSGRSEQLRRQAELLPGPAAVALRRRAAELEMQSWLLEVRFAATPPPAPRESAA